MPISVNEQTIELVKGELVEERLYAGSDSIPANSTTPVKVVGTAIPAGYEGVVVSIACTQNADSAAFLKIEDKQYYDNGLNTAGLGGLAQETPLLVKVKENNTWELGFTNASGSAITMNWRIRVRHYKL